MAWNGGGAGNLSDIVHKGGSSVKSNVDLDDVVVTLPIDKLEADIETVEEAFEEARETLVKDVKKSEAIAANKAQKLRGKINDLVAEELRDFFEEV